MIVLSHTPTYARCMSQTTIRVDTAQREALARVAAERQESQDAALRRLIWEHDCRESIVQLQADPDAYASYLVVTQALGDAAPEVIE